MDRAAPAARLTVPSRPAGDAGSAGVAAPAEPATLAALADLVTVVDRLRSPGGCPWYAEQTHASLLPYAIEEVHEVVEAVEAGDHAGLLEELGDLLLQAVLHARLGEEHPERPFALAEVAAGAAAKLRRRNPHVFGDDASAEVGTDVEAEVLDVAVVHRRYQRLKQAEKQRESVMDGIPPTLPALARARKVLDRAHRAGLDDVAEPRTAPADGVPGPDDGTSSDASTDLGDRLLALVADAGPGVDAEAALRAALRRLEGRTRATEHARRTVHHVEGT